MAAGLGAFLCACLLGCARTQEKRGPEARVGAGWDNYRLGEFSLALKDFQSAAANSPGGSEIRLAALYGEATTWHLRRPDEDLKRAEQLYRQVIELAPTNNLAAWSLLALARIKSLPVDGEAPDLKQQVAAYQEVINRFPFHPAGEEALLMQQAAKLAAPDKALTHRRGFGVIIDVVYNHVGGANSFAKLDRRSYFRLDAEDGYSNFSGCGNDLRTESPVMRRLIVDNVLYWIKEHHVDGFRFDLAELIDMETMMAVQQAAKAANPEVVLIAEPWSSRGDQKQALRGTAWAAWNNQFTHPVRSFIKGEGRSDEVMKAIAGSVELWTTSPMQSINYFESHDDMALADELSTAPGRDGRILTPADTARHRLAATVLFTSLGIPMLNEGQEFLRSKHGIRNTFDRGDLINALRWSDRERPYARETLVYYRDMIRLRQSPEGASLRLAMAPPANYYEWITPGSGQLLGYRINARHERPGRAFVVLVNASQRDDLFDVEFSGGQWKLVGDGHTVDLAGKIMSPMSVAGGTRNRIKVPALTSYVFMDDP